MIHFYKYQGTGNDFIIIDNRELAFLENRQRISKLCDRKFGIGADGLILLQNRKGYDFEMIYFNADGKTSSMCGNGGRCITAFAERIGIITEKAYFLAIDGPHEAKMHDGLISLKMNDVNKVEVNPGNCFLDTGSPHYVQFIKDLENWKVAEEGRKIRYNERFAQDGTNVNFVECVNGNVKVRTYERGVENETLSCGTGVTAVALCASIKKLATSADFCDIKTSGGSLRVYFKKHPNNRFSDIWLEGPADFVFKGELREIG